MQALDHEVTEGGAVRRDGGGMLKPIHQHILFIKKSVGNLCAAGIDPNSVPHRYAPRENYFRKYSIKRLLSCQYCLRMKASSALNKKRAVFLYHSTKRRLLFGPRRNFCG